MQHFIFFAFIFYSVSAFCQDDTLRSDLKTSFEIRKNQLDNNLLPDRPRASHFDTDIPDYRPIVNQFAPINLNLPPIHTYVGPMLKEETQYLHFPYHFDYNFTAVYGLSPKSYLITNSYHSTFPTLGQISSVGTQFGYQPTSWLNLSGGPFASKYEVYGNLYNNIGVNGKAQFILNDRIRVNGYGQYSTNNKVVAPMSSMYNPTYYGGTLEVRITDTFGLEGGMMRELNPFSGKWVNKPYLSPVFYQSKPKKRQDPNREK